MVERPILMSSPMVRAIQAGTKTQTRRVLKVRPPASTVQFCAYHHPDPRPHHWAIDGGALLDFAVPCPYGQAGDRLWVRETFYAWGRWETRYSAKKGRDEWHFVDMTLECGKSYSYTAEGNQPQPMGGKRHKGGITPAWWKRPAIHMPRKASRITLEVVSVRVERLSDISVADCIAEGIDGTRLEGVQVWLDYNHGGKVFLSARHSYVSLWESINGPESWVFNPWVWVVEFKKV